MTSTDHDPIDSSTRGIATRSSGKRIAVIVVSAVVAIAIAAGALFFITRGADAAPVPSASPTPEETTSETPSPTPTPVQTPTGIALPADCEAAFSPDYFALRSADPWNPLNDETVDDSRITAVEEAEALRAGLPQLRCTWAVAGEEGILSSIADVTPTESAEALALLEESGQTCVAYREGTSCSVVYTNSDEVPVAGEEHFFRDNIWISAFWANIVVDGYNDDIIDTLWAN